MKESKLNGGNFDTMATSSNLQKKPSKLNSYNFDSTVATS